ncbi:MAG: CinA family nicotinamide mononucleotide deamidase-related protein [Proteocatella sp.]
MNAEIIAVGTELLHGDIANTNAQYISKEFAKIGIDVHFHTVVGDNAKRMKMAFDIALSRADIVICTGGLGPTQDDITKEIVAQHLELPMLMHEESKKHLENRFAQRNRIMTQNNLRQAYFPKGAIVLENDNGTANACIIETNQKIMILLPGPPREIQPLMEKDVMGYLKKYSNQVVLCSKIQVLNIGESTAETLIMDIIESQTNPTIASYAGSSSVVFRVTAKADSQEEAIELINPVVKELMRRFGDNGSILEKEY